MRLAKISLQPWSLRHLLPHLRSYSGLRPQSIGKCRVIPQIPP